jgi:hypothetical protein
LQCPTNAWSLTYPVSFWRGSYCPNEQGIQAGACNATNPNRPEACDLDLPGEPPFDQFELGLPAALQTCFSLRTAASKKASPQAQSSFQSIVCGCLESLESQDEATANNTASALNAVLRFDFNTTTVVPPKDVQAPAQCANATFVPARNLFVCNAQGPLVRPADACQCPKDVPFSNWGSDISAECFEFVVAAAEGGKCLVPAAPALIASGSLPVQARCRISTCPCPEAPPRTPE